MHRSMIQGIHLAFPAGIVLILSSATFAQSLSHADKEYDFLPGVIAFGSCNNQKQPQDIWQSIDKTDPDVWIWLGDNIYADTENMKIMEKDYQLQKSHPGYRDFIKDRQVIGIWDDHDYGVNDGDKYFPKARESKVLMLEFLNVPKSHPVWEREGAYQSYSFNDGHKKIKVILLDGRSFRDKLVKKKGRYIPDPHASLLGDDQWEWLNGQLEEENVDLFLISCGIQFIPEQHKFEKWANFPTDRSRLFSLLVEKQPGAVFLLSGDRHIAEVSCTSLDGLDYPLCELTSSGLTHAWEEIGEEPNSFRSGPLIAQRNFGLLKLRFDKKGDLILGVEVKSVDGQTLHQVDFSF